MHINKLSQRLPFVFILTFLFQTGLFSQDKRETTNHPEETKLRFPIPQDKFEGESYSLEDDIANLISAVANQLFLDDIVICIQVDTTTGISNMGSNVVLIPNWDELKQYVEALVVTHASLTQTESPKKINDGYFLNTNDPHSKYILTKLSLSAYFLDINTKENLGPFDLEIQESARTRKESRSRVLDSLKKRLLIELKRIYWLSSDVASIINDMLTIPLGTDQDIKKGLIFELVVPETIWTINDEDLIKPPKTVGLMSVVETASESSTLKLFRKWDYLFEGSWVVEHFRPSYALELSYVPPITSRYFNLGINWHARPFQNLDFGGGCQFIRVTDSFDNDDYGLGFSGFGIWRCIDKPGMNIGGKLGASLDIPFKKDDIGSTVFTALFSFNIGILAEITINKRFDLVVNSGYRLAIKSDKWTYSEGDDTYPAVWDGDAPVVDNSGLFFSLGFHYLLF